MQQSSVWLRRLVARDTLAGPPDASLAAINTTTLPDGCIVWVSAELGDYQLQRAGGLVADGVHVITANGPGQWVSLRDKTVVLFGDLRPSLANPPTPIEVGPTMGYLMVVADAVYSEIPLVTRVDRSRNLLVGIGWAPSSAEVGRTVTWRFEIGLMKVGKSVVVIDVTDDVTVPYGAQAIYVHTSSVLLPAQWGTDPDYDELHLRISRIASGADPVFPPGVHHIVAIEPLL